MHKKLLAVSLLLIVGAGCTDAGVSTPVTTPDSSGDSGAAAGTVEAGSGANVDAADNPIDDTAADTGLAETSDMVDDSDAGDETSTVQEFMVNGDNFTFSPSSMIVKKGDTVQITFTNTEGFHDLKIDEYDVATAKLNAGGTETIEFVADKAGTFEYYCSVGSHRAMGMKGTLTVEE